MLRWWLNLRWASETHADSAAKLRLAFCLGLATMIAVVLLR